MDFIVDLVNSIVEGLLSFLPDSPFSGFIESVAELPYLSYLNWFVPVGTFIAIGSTWLVAIGVFYIYQAILRWAKVIGD